MNQQILIQIDTNDADYMSSANEITDEEIEKIRPVIEAIKNFKPYIGTKKSYKNEHDSNYPTGECCREDLGEKTAEELYGHIPGFETFEELLPYPEYGFHTIESIKIIQIVERLL
jgi:hypothetical protein